MPHYRMEYLLNEELTRVQLAPADEIVGRKFFFGCEHGSHAHALAGTITGVKWSDEGGLKLFVSVPEMWGEPLNYLTRRDNSWSALVGARFSPGTFCLL